MEFFYPLAAYKEFESRGNDTLDIFTFFSEKFGEDYAENLLLRKWQEQADELNRNFYQRNPEYMSKLSMLSKYNVSLFLRGSRIYGLGPLTVYKIYKQIGEDNYYNFMKAIYKEYYDKKEKKLSFTDFLNITSVNKEAIINE
ncbi:MAG: hypothetical protein E7214_06255 [Clostridium sp.]|nr:hypothetical protein [Clostridium sp.]